MSGSDSVEEVWEDFLSNSDVEFIHDSSSGDESPSFYRANRRPLSPIPRPKYQTGVSGEGEPFSNLVCAYNFA